MKFFASTLVLSAAVLFVSARPMWLTRRNVDPSLVPQFGVNPGVNPTGTGDCDGIPNAQGVAIKIPCICPPDRNSFIAVSHSNHTINHHTDVLMYNIPGAQRERRRRPRSE